jgi:hypothetical protein
MKNLKHRSFVVFFVIISFVVISCSNEDTVYVKFDRDTFTEQRQLWQQSNVKNYKYDLFVTGFVNINYTIIIEDGNFKDSSPQTPAEYFTGYSTIDEIYKTIEQESLNLYNIALKTKSDGYYAEILVEYDKVNHIPIKIQYIYNRYPYPPIDEPSYYEISNFNRTE